MGKVSILLMVMTAYVNAQVCCSPVGSSQAGGGTMMSSWVTHWPNILMGNENWHWMADMQMTTRAPVGNINYGPELNAQFEVSRSVSNRNVAFINAYAGLGTLEENVTYLSSATLSYTGGISGGVRVALGNRGRTFGQVMFNLPGRIRYENDEFPFTSEAGMSLGFVVLHSISFPWATINPDLLANLSLSWMYQKNLQVQDNILSDHLSIVHLASSIQSMYPFFVAPFVQMRTEQLIAPPTVWTSERGKRLLMITSVGMDLALSKPHWDKVKIRIALPIFARSSSNGFPDGTQPAAYISMALNTSGIVPNI